MRRFQWEHTTYLHVIENQTDPYYAFWPGALSTLIGSNYPSLELTFVVPKVFEPLKFDCIQLYGAPVAQWVRHLQTDKAVTGSSLTRCEIFSTINGAPLHIAFHCHPPIVLIWEPGRVAQSVGHLTRKSGVLGSIPGLATYFRFSFRFFKKGNCQLLAKVCARGTG